MPRRPISNKQRKAIFAKYAARKSGPTLHRLNEDIDSFKEQSFKEGKMLTPRLRRQFHKIELEAERALEISKTQNR